MRIGLNLPNYGPLANPDDIVAVSRAAEELGYDSLWTGDRILTAVHPSDRYPGGDGTMPEQMNISIDPLQAMTFAAAVTSRVRLGTSTLNGPWYQPVLLARQLTTLDVLSGGRLDVGLGLGWSRDEYRAVGVPWQERGSRLDELLDVLEKIWAGGTVSHEGEHHVVPESSIEPKPVQRPGPPILLAGFTPRAMSRVARRGDGWLAVGMPLPRLAALWSTITTEAEGYGRKPRMVLRVNPRLSDSPAAPERVPGAGTIEQVAEYAHAAQPDEVFVDLTLTTSSREQMLDVAGRLLPLLRS